MKRLFYFLTILLLAGALLALPALCVSDKTVEDPQTWLVQLSSPLPAALAEEDSTSFILPVHASQDVYLITDPTLVEMLLDENMLAWAEPDMEVELFTDTESTDETDISQWHLDMLNTSRGDTLGCFGQGVRVAVIDSGCAPHKDLSTLLPGHNFLTNTDDTDDNIGHGTFVSGLIAAADDGIGATGAAPGAEILPLKCFDTGASTRVSTLTTAIYAAVDEYDCQVINMSFGLKSYSKALDTAISYAVDHGVVCVASAGNLGNSTPYYPAALPNVIGVGSVDSSTAVSSFSQRNDSLSVMAPGRDVYSTTADGDYSAKNGTSFSAPLISALCARLLTADDTLTPQDVMRLLTASAIELGDEGYDTTYGYGLADLEGAMELLLVDTDCFLSPFYMINEDLQITLFNNTDRDLSGQCIFTRYQNGLMEDISWHDLCLAPGDAITVISPLAQHTIKCTFWPSFIDISPITPYRECEVSS